MTSDKYRTIVKRQHVRHREARLLLGILAAALLLGLGYFLGHRDIPSELSQTSIPGAEKELAVLRDNFEAQEVQHQLDIATLEIVRKEIAAQKDQVSQLEEGLQFYKSLMAPEAITQGLSLRKLELVATDEPDRFVFRLVAQQEALKHPLLKGTLSIELFGQWDGDEISYPLAKLSDDFEESTVALRFRYFQAVEGELQIPPGFEPRGFKVVAKASSPHKAELREEYPWEVHERFTYVGK
jgi:Tfp pilus assembly protein PilO